MAGVCYEDAWRSVTSERWADPRITAFLVHGYPHLTGADGEVPVGTRYGHAWVELTILGTTPAEDRVVCVNADPEITVPQIYYYIAGRIDERWVRRYTQAEARDMALRHGTYGPWHLGPPDTYLPDEGA